MYRSRFFLFFFFFFQRFRRVKNDQNWECDTGGMTLLAGLDFIRTRRTTRGGKMHRGVNRAQFSAFRSPHLFVRFWKARPGTINQSPQPVDVNLSNDQSCATNRGESNSARSIHKFEKKKRERKAPVSPKDREIAATFSSPGYVNLASLLVFFLAVSSGTSPTYRGNPPLPRRFLTLESST